jgi:hypothetical protein
MVITPEKEKEDQHDNERGRFEERDAEQALILQHVAPPPGRNCRHCGALAAAKLDLDGVNS